MNKNHDEMISVVIPVYMGKCFLSELCARLEATLKDLVPVYEIILVNDASPDQCWPDIEKLCKETPAIIKGIDLSRNFGQHYAITAGLSVAKGDWIVVMDCDLQDIPEEIATLFAKAREGYDSVFAQRVERQDSLFKCLSSKLFYKLFSFLTNSPMDPAIANFGIYHKQVIQAILSMGDNIRYLPTMAQWVGFRKAYCPVKHAPRTSGKSSYSLWKLIKLAVDNMIAFSDKLLRIIAIAGLWIALSAFLLSAFYMTLALLGKIKVAGYASLILSVWFIGGVLMMTIGVVGIYVGKTFSQVKGRPGFIVAKKINFDGDSE